MIKCIVDDGWYPPGIVTLGKIYKSWYDFEMQGDIFIGDDGNEYKVAPGDFKNLDEVISEFEQKIRDIVKVYPNDADLGRNIREIVK